MPRRLAWWTALTAILWLLYVAWQVLAILGAIGQLREGDEFVRTHGYNFQPAPSSRAFAFDQLGALFGDPSAAATAALIVSLWGLVGAACVAAMRANPFHWVGGKRVIWGGFALMLMLGRFWAAWLTAVLGLIPAFVLVPLAPLMMIFFGCCTTLCLFGLVATAFGFFIGIPVMFFNQLFQFEHALRVYRYQKTGLANYLIRFGYWLTGQAVPKPPDDSKGARFATHQEVVDLHAFDDPQAMGFGHRGNPLFLKTVKHVLIMASTRSGKGVTVIIPHLLRYQGSAFILDPKAENARATCRRRSQLNGKVHVLDPFGISGKPQARFNPLSRFTPDNMEAESKALAAALFLVGDRERDHWTAAGQQLLAAIILYVYVTPDIPTDKKDLPTVRRILLGNLEAALDAMTLIDDADGLLRDLALSFIKTPEKELGSIISTAQRQTEILDNPFIVACLSATGPGEEVDFKAWHNGTMTVFLCLSAPKFPVFNRWLRLVLTSALDEMTDTLNPPPLPVCFMLDELATLGHLAAVENAVGLAAGYGIQLVTVFQDTAQMRDLYKGRWASFIGNAGVRALFNLDDFDTAEYWSKFIGGHLVETRSQQQDIYGYSKGDNVGEVLRPLLAPEEIMMVFAAGRMLVLAQGARPIVTDRVAYWQDRSLDGLWDDPRRPLPPPRPKVAPQAAAPAQPKPAASSAGTGAAAQAASPPQPPSAPPSPAAAKAEPARAPAPVAASTAAAAPAPAKAPSPPVVKPVPASTAHEAATATTAAPASAPRDQPKAAQASASAANGAERDAPARDWSWITFPDPHARSQEVMDYPTTMKDPPRNAPCPCGSGKKYKHCHGREDGGPPVGNTSASPHGGDSWN